MIFYFKILINSIISIFTVHFPKFLDSLFNPKDMNEKDMEKSNKFFRFVIIFALSIVTLVFLIGNISYMVQIGDIVIYSETKVETKYPELKYNSSEYNKLVNQYKNEHIESSDSATAEVAKILKDSIFENMELYDIYAQLQFFVLTSCLLNFFAIIIFFACLIVYFIMTEDNYLSETKYRLGFNKISDDEEYLILHNPALKYKIYWEIVKSLLRFIFSFVKVFFIQFIIAILFIFTNDNIKLHTGYIIGYIIINILLMGYLYIDFLINFGEKELILKNNRIFFKDKLSKYKDFGEFFNNIR